MRVPADFVDVEAESDDSENLFDAYSDESYSGAEEGYDEFEGSNGVEDEGDEVSITEEEEEEENGGAGEGDGDQEDDWEDVQDEVEDIE